MFLTLLMIDFIYSYKGVIQLEMKKSYFDQYTQSIKIYFISNNFFNKRS